MVDWPTELPTEGLSGVTDQFVGAKILSEVDQGPPIARQRYTKARRPVNIPITLTNAQRIVFDEWYSTDLKYGVLSFNWVDPVTGVSRSFKFREADGPQWSGSGGGDVKRHTANLALEIW